MYSFLHQGQHSDAMFENYWTINLILAHGFNPLIQSVGWVLIRESSVYVRVCGVTGQPYPTLQTIPRAWLGIRSYSQSLN